jgi:hypothetical protein
VPEEKGTAPSFAVYGQGTIPLWDSGFLFGGFREGLWSLTVSLGDLLLGLWKVVEHFCDGFRFADHHIHNHIYKLEERVCCCDIVFQVDLSWIHGTIADDPNNIESLLNWRS